MSEKNPLEAYIGSLEEKLLPLQGDDQPGSIRWHIKWYQDRYRLRGIAYRVAGVATLAITAIVPIASGLGASTTTVATILLPLLAGLCTFFALKAAWSGYYLAQLNLEHLLQIYRMQLLNARRMAEAAETGAGNPISIDEAIELVRSATEELIKNSNQIVNDETEAFFKAIKSPMGKIQG